MLTAGAYRSLAHQTQDREEVGLWPQESEGPGPGLGLSSATTSYRTPGQRFASDPEFVHQRTRVPWEPPFNGGCEG